jgi:signal transduction histidine kinase/DNA-binding response OmpR family regulator
LCCTLESRCHDSCKPHGRFGSQLTALLQRLLPPRIAAALHTRAGHFAGILVLCNATTGLLLSFIYRQYSGLSPAALATVATTLWLVFLSLLLLSGIGAWLIVLAHESRRSAEAESARHTAMLMEEIEAHRRTDSALQHAKEAAEAANQAKTRYIVGISHEIRAPLNSIFGYAQLLERGSAGSADNAVRVIRRSAEHLSNLIDGLLDVSRIENGMLRLDRNPVQLPELLEQLVDMFRLQAAAKGLAFHYIPAAHLPARVHADQKRLRQIMINLLSNAIKYTERGSVSLAVRYRSEIAEFEVSDTGAGIAAEDLERIFEPFERGSSSSVRSVPGTGLGLTITKLLTQIMGGEVLVTDSSAAGTTFLVRLLLSEIRQEASEAQAIAPSSEAATQSICDYAGARRRILLADDDPQHLQLMQQLLSPLGFTVFSARDGKTCIQLAEQCRPDLAMVDLAMPDLSGWLVAQQLRALPSLPRLKIMIVSANAHDYSPGSGTLHDAFVMKPVELGTLLEWVRTLLNLKWIRSNQGADASRPASATAALHARSRHHLDDLYRLGRIGHVRGIEAKLRELELEDPGNEAFAAHLRALVSSFDLKRYMTVVEAMRADA